MNKYVLTISIGPVQGFIAAARKTRDLWAGSQLLSDISKSVALALNEEPDVELIFPGIDSNDVSKLKNPKFSVANVVTCTATTDDEQRLRDLVKKAKDAAHTKWGDFVKATKKRIEELKDEKFWEENIRQDFWNSQTKAEDVIEFFAAWKRIENGDETEALLRAASILAGRKNCHEFTQPIGYDGFGVPKSSLDGARESVLKKELVKNDAEKIYLKPGEQLDAIGLVKRLGVQEETYKKECPSLLDIAIRPWLKSKKLDYDNIVKFIDRAESLGDFLQDLNVRGDNVFHNLIQTIQEIDEQGLYVAILLADGDKMGATLADLKTSAERRKFSQALSRFSSGVEKRVQVYGGLCVYAGGDDVLAFLSVDQALDCANNLRLWFNEAMRAYAKTSLSVGVVIFHYHEMLDQALDFARQAEKIAKTTNDGYKDEDTRFGDRNGLAVSFYSRGNVATTIRERWSDDKEQIADSLTESLKKEHNAEYFRLTQLKDTLVERLKYWANAFQNDLPRGFPYDLYELINSRVYRPEKNSPTWSDSEMLANALHRDVMRIVQQKENVSKESDLFKKISERVDELKTEADLKRFVHELLVAKEIGAYEYLVNRGV